MEIKTYLKKLSLIQSVKKQTANQSNYNILIIYKDRSNERLTFPNKDDRDIFFEKLSNALFYFTEIELLNQKILNYKNKLNAIK